MKFLIIATVCVLFSGPSSSQVNSKDSLALVDLYNSTNGANWNNHTNWLTLNPVSTWYGVTVGNGRVTRLTLGPPPYGNNLNGTVPSSLGKLSMLTCLDLSFNKLSDTIPSSLGNLILLDTLNFWTNSLTGRIPSSLKNLSNLGYIALGFNQLSGAFPSWLGNLSKLHHIYLQSNYLTGTIPSSLGNLSNLIVLVISSNNLSDTIPSSLRNLSNLQVLFLGSNDLTGNLPSWLGNLSQLKTIGISFTQITGNIPASLGNLSNLAFLYLDNNTLNGSVPSSLGNLSNLNNLQLINNQLDDSIPTSLTNLSKLTSLDLRLNKFTFSGMENIVSKFSFAHYAPQANISLIKNGNFLSVSPGGTPSNDTFRLYKDSVLTAIQTGDSTFAITSTGKYNITVTNAVAKQLTLYSDTLVVDSIITTVSIKKNIAVIEGNSGYTTAQFKISLDHASASTVKVDYTTKDGSALAGSDYISNSGTLTFKPGKISKNITINVIGDNTYESNEKFSLVLSNPLNAVLGDLDSATCTIKNDDPLSPQAQTNNDALANSKTIELFPNPVKDELKIEGLNSTRATLSVVDMHGRELIKTFANNESRTINVKQLSAGVYYLRIESDAKDVILKFVKQ